MRTRELWWLTLLLAVALLVGCHRWTGVRVSVSHEVDGSSVPLAGAKVRLLEPDAEACADPPYDNPRYRGEIAGERGVASFYLPYCAPMNAIVAHAGYHTKAVGIDSCTVETNETLEVSVALQRRERAAAAHPSADAAESFIQAASSDDPAAAEALIAPGADIVVANQPLADRRHVAAHGFHVVSVDETDGQARVCLLAVADDGCERPFVFQLRHTEEGWRVTAIEARACPE